MKLLIDPETEVMVEENHSDLMYGIVDFQAFEISSVHEENKIIRIRAK